MNTFYSAMKASARQLALLLPLILFSFLVLAGEHHHDTHTSIHRAVVVEPTRAAMQALKGSDFSYSIQVNGRKLNFELTENKQLMSLMNTNGGSGEHFLLEGKIKGIDESWVRFSRQNNQVTGAFYDGDSLYFLENLAEIESRLTSHSLEGYSAILGKKENLSVLVDIRDMDSSGTCALHNSQLTASQTYSSFVQDLKTATSSAGKEIKISLVADTEFVGSTSRATATLEMLEYLNIADGIFSNQLGVSISVEDITELSDNGDFIETDPQALLFKFRDEGTPNPGLRHLFTGKNLDGSTVGIAYVGALCNKFAVGLTQRVGSLTSIVFAHELGHNFGAPHDNQSGTACASTPSGFVMNPNAGGGGNEFSACSIEQMTPVIDANTNGFNACIIEVANTAPSITSNPNTTVIAGNSYRYDSDNTLDVTGTAPYTYTLDIAPDEMTIDSNGTLVWVPNTDDVGEHPVQITVSNAVGQDTQFFEIEVETPVSDGAFINFEQSTISSHDPGQDNQGGATIGATPYELVLEGNTWKSIAFDYEITADTILEFEFSSDIEAEIQGIGFDSRPWANPQRTFSIYGFQRWGIRDVRYDGSGNKQRISIRVGDYYQGPIGRLFFVHDNDRLVAGANSTYSNIRVYEEGAEAPSDPEPEEPSPSPEPSPEAINLGQLSINPLRADQNGEGTVTIVENGLGIEIVGNKWEAVSIPNKEIKPTSILEFEYKSTAQGEIHGIGIFPNDGIFSNRAFQLGGRQSWGIRDFTYIGNGDYQTFRIPVGEYFTHPSVSLVFIMDHDVRNPNGNVTFKNIVLKDN